VSVQEKLFSLQTEIAAIAKASLDVTIISVSKNVPISQMMEAYHAGACHFGESRAQELIKKKELLPSDVIWHFIGPIQSNKVKAIVAASHYIHSVCSIAIAEKISKASVEQNRKSSCFFQLNLAREKTKQGFLEEEFIRDFPRLMAYEGILPLGLMVIGPHTKDQKAIRECFHRAKVLNDRCHLPYLSMGMSSDFSIAIEEGATHIRVGSRLFS
jgi:PLP dependent protein